MRWRITAALVALFACPTPSIFAQAYRIGVDPRVELMSIIFRLAGNGEYNEGRVPSYHDAIDRYFGPYRDHKAVQIARELRNTDGVSFDAPMNLAVRLKAVESLAERVPFDRPDAGLDDRWHGVKARAFVDALRSFVTDTRFNEFFKSQQALYDLTDSRLRKFVETDLDLPWYTRFFGARSPVRFIIVPGLVNGGPSYGSSVVAEDGIEEMYAIPGVFEVDAGGLPRFSSGDFLQTTVHEFVHSYANPLVDKYYAQLAGAGDQLNDPLRDAMRRQGYGDGRTLLDESMVRAATIRYIFDHAGPEAAQRAEEAERARSFLWIGDLCDLLATYEKNREAYPTLDSFMPKVVQFFNDEAPRIGELQRSYEDSRPKVASMSIANHSQDVDPGVREIVIRFTRPVRQVRDPQKARDPRLGPLLFDKTGTVLSIPVTLEPDRQYRFPLTWPEGEPFVSADGVPMNLYTIEFHTRHAVSASTRQ